MPVASRECFELQVDNETKAKEVDGNLGVGSANNHQQRRWMRAEKPQHTAHNIAIDQA